MVDVASPVGMKSVNNSIYENNEIYCISSKSLFIWTVCVISNIKTLKVAECAICFGANRKWNWTKHDKAILIRWVANTEHIHEPRKSYNGFPHDWIHQRLWFVRQKKQSFWFIQLHLNVLHGTSPDESLLAKPKSLRWQVNITKQKHCSFVVDSII